MTPRQTWKEFAVRFNLPASAPAIMTSLLFKDLYLLVFSFLGYETLVNVACVCNLLW